MYQGNCVVAKATLENSKIIQNDYTGYLYNHMNKAVKKFCSDMEKTPDLVEEISENAKQFVIKNYSRQQFQKSWDELISRNL